MLILPRTAIGAGLVVFLLAVSHASGDELRPLKELHLEVIQRELPQTTVHSIIQSRDGYIWVATYEGVVRMDGVAFVVLDRQSTSGGLAANGVLDIHEADDGSLWFGTFLGGVSRLAEGEWKNWGNDQGLEGEFVRSVSDTPDGTIWVGTNSGVFTLAGDRAVRPADARLTGPVRQIVRMQSGDLLVGFEDGRLLRVGTGGAVEDLSPLLSGHGVFAVASGPDDVVWAGTEGGGLFRIQRGEATRFGRADGLTSDKIRALMVDPTGTVWIGTEGGGLCRLTETGIESLTTRDGMPNDIVRAVMRDREGSVWLGTNGGGLVVLKRHKFSLYTTRRGMSSDAVRVILETRDGAIWIGTDGGGVNVIRNGRVTNVGSAHGLPSDFARSLYEGRDGTVWIGTVGGGIARHRDGTTRPFEVRLPSDTILSIAETPDGALWVGTNRGVAEVSEGRVRRTFDQSTGLGDNNVNALQVDESGRIWAGTSSGLFIIDKSRIETVQLEGSLSRSIFCIRIDPDGSAWIGSNAGLARLKNGSVFQFTREHGMPEKAVFQILEDSFGDLWISGNRGIHRVSKSALETIANSGAGRVETTRFGQADGMLTDQCNGASQPAGWAASDGSLWFPTPWGAATIDVTHMPSNTLAPPVRIERFTVNGTEARFDEDTIELAAGRHRLEIDYTAMSFIAPEAVRFRTRLEGLDDAWVEAGSRRTEIYTNIGPGEYRFQVIASNNDGVWNEEGASFRLRVRPFFWQRPSFIGLALAIGLLLVWLIVQLRVVQLEHHKRELAELVEQRTSELEDANRKLQHLSATDSLTGTANRRRFEEVLDAEWKRAFRSGDALSILMLDVDNFKPYNDDFGHQQGDVCLRTIASAIMGSARRAGDIVARYGGDEFAAVLAGTSRESAISIADSAREAVEQLNIRSQSNLSVTLSVGVATTIPSEGRSIRALIAAADRALYKAKRSGRNRVESTQLGSDES